MADLSWSPEQVLAETRRLLKRFGVTDIEPGDVLAWRLYPAHPDSSVPEQLVIEHRQQSKFDLPGGQR